MPEDTERCTVDETGMHWGPMNVCPMIHVPKKGYVLGVDAAGGRLQVYVSEKGKSVRVYKDGHEMVVRHLRAVRAKKA